MSYCYNLSVYHIQIQVQSTRNSTMNGENRVSLHAAGETIHSFVCRQSLTRKDDSLLALLVSTGTVYLALFTRLTSLSIQYPKQFIVLRVLMNLLQRSCSRSNDKKFRFFYYNMQMRLSIKILWWCYHHSQDVASVASLSSS